MLLLYLGLSIYKRVSFYKTDYNRELLFYKYQFNIFLLGLSRKLLALVSEEFWPVSIFLYQGIDLQFIVSIRIVL